MATRKTTPTQAYGFSVVLNARPGLTSEEIDQLGGEIDGALEMRVDQGLFDSDLGTSTVWSVVELAAIPAAVLNTLAASMAMTQDSVTDRISDFYDPIEGLAEQRGMDAATRWLEAQGAPVKDIDDAAPSDEFMAELEAAANAAQLKLDAEAFANRHKALGSLQSVAETVANVFGSPLLAAWALGYKFEALADNGLWVGYNENGDRMDDGEYQTEADAGASALYLSVMLSQQKDA